MDHKLTQDIYKYLNTSADQRDVVVGASLLLKLNRNRILFQNACKRPQKFAARIEYELQKFLNMRIDSKTVADVVEMDKTVLPSAAYVLSEGAPVISTDDDSPLSGEKVLGRRVDHDELPEEIQNIWTYNGSLFFKIKALFEQLKAMNDAPACDRYELLKQLSEADKTYREGMATYDNYQLGDELPSVSKKEAQAEEPADITKKVNAARKYLSENKKKLATLQNTDEKEFNAHLLKVQERYDFLIQTGNTVDADQQAELVALGLKA